MSRDGHWQISEKTVRRVELLSVARNYKEIISAQNKEEFSSSPSNTNIDGPTYGDRRPDECWDRRTVVHGVGQTSDVGLDKTTFEVPVESLITYDSWIL